MSDVEPLPTVTLGVAIPVDLVHLTPERAATVVADLERFARGAALMADGVRMLHHLEPSPPPEPRRRRRGADR